MGNKDSGGDNDDRENFHILESKRVDYKLYCNFYPDENTHMKMNTFKMKFLIIVFFRAWCFQEKKTPTKHLFHLSTDVLSFLNGKNLPGWIVLSDKKQAIVLCI